MIQGFWKKLKKPFVVLAPMADVTDPAFRRLIAKYSEMGKEGGGPHVMWTEFVSADGLCSPGRAVLARDLEFSEGERPIVAQLFTSHPEKMEKAAALCAELGFDGIDINMGCPDKSIEKQGAGAAMMKDPASARAVIEAARRGAPLLPISVKTRVGYNKVELDTWVPELLACDIASLAIHARTRKEMSDVPARWEHVAEVVAMRDRLQAGRAEKTLILGNGDVTTLEDAYAKCEKFGADGAMVGRGIFGNPWFFNSRISKAGGVASISIPDRLKVMVEHTKLFDELLGDYKNFAIMKKHYKAYVNGWDGAKELRVKLMESMSVSEVEVIIDDYLSKNKF